MTHPSKSYLPRLEVAVCPFIAVPNLPGPIGVVGFSLTKIYIVNKLNYMIYDYM